MFQFITLCSHELIELGLPLGYIFLREGRIGFPDGIPDSVCIIVDSVVGSDWKDILCVVRTCLCIAISLASGIVAQLNYPSRTF